jgi:hypothetical protein
MDLDINVFDNILVQEFGQAKKENYLFFALPLIIQTVTIADSGPTILKKAYLTWQKDVNIVLEDETTIFKEGLGTANNLNSGSMRITPATAFVTGKMCWKAFPSVQDFSAYDKISFWIQSSTTLAGNTLKVQLCSDTAGNVPVDEFTIDVSLQLGRWYPITLPRNGGGFLSSSIQSVVLYALIDPATPNIYFDNMVACKDLTLNSLIGKNTVDDECWFPIKSISADGLTIYMGHQALQGTTPVQKYYGVSEIVESFALEPVVTRAHLATSSAQIIMSVKQGNGSGQYTIIKGGYNPATGICDGKTFYDGLNGWGYGLSHSGKDYAQSENLGFVRYSTGFNPQSNFNGWGMGKIWCIGNSSYGIQGSGNGRVVGKIKLWTIMNGVDGYSLDTRYTRIISIYAISNIANGISFPSSTWNLVVGKVVANGNATSAGVNFNNQMGQIVDEIEARYNAQGVYFSNTNLCRVGKGVISYNGTGVYTNGCAVATVIDCILEGNTSRDILLSGMSIVKLFGCSLKSATPFSLTDGDSETCAVISINEQQVGGKRYRKINNFGEIKDDTVNFRTASPCYIMTPTSYSGAMGQGIANWIETVFNAPADSGVARTLSVYIKRSVDYVGTDSAPIKINIGVRYKGEYHYLGSGLVDISKIVYTGYQKFSITVPSGDIIRDGVLELCVRTVSDGIGSLYIDDFEWS